MASTRPDWAPSQHTGLKALLLEDHSRGCKMPLEAQLRSHTASLTSHSVTQNSQGHCIKRTSQDQPRIQEVEKQTSRPHGRSSQTPLSGAGTLGCVLSRPVVSDSCYPIDCGLPGSSIHGIVQARILGLLGALLQSSLQAVSHPFLSDENHKSNRAG